MLLFTFLQCAILQGMQILIGFFQILLKGVTYISACIFPDYVEVAKAVVVPRGVGKTSSLT